MQQPPFMDEGMIWTILAQLYSTLLELLRLSRLSTDEKDLEILVLRQQLDMLARKNNQVVRPSRGEKWSLAVLTAILKKRSQLTTTQLGKVIRIFKPETVDRLASGASQAEVETETC